MGCLLFFFFFFFVVVVFFIVYFIFFFYKQITVLEKKIWLQFSVKKKKPQKTLSMNVACQADSSLYPTFYYFNGTVTSQIDYILYSDPTAPKAYSIFLNAIQKMCQPIYPLQQNYQY